MSGRGESNIQWRKSSRSTNTGGDCVEAAALPWRKSSRSGDTGGQCVEVVGIAAAVGVRDSKDPDGPKLVFASAEWRSFARRAKSGGFDLR
ncbi:DUF397 domain-containing protein [Actinomadura latina]|uniref:DUF397 domain-containing protein n=1 Tax=Actinomadura latina TaxID=163603 RepID=A0A846Z168_9ACTN|nr:DUF397 domain-containing protein [Actinomadura latina]NKZ05667.1 DUF397 domain-containing protein [Actinomadura latina]